LQESWAGTEWANAMTLDEQSGLKSAPDMAAALNQLWIRFLPETHDRVAHLKAAARASLSCNLSQQERETAHAAAHKLAGTLGTFNLMRGTELAREFEQLCEDKNSNMTVHAERLVALAAEISAIVDGRQ
jgi:HPt (histidine-containing phosphotransfer) domain-containing protein